MKKSFFAVLTSALFVTFIPVTAQATPGDTTTYPIICASSGNVYVYLDYGVTAITITNPNGCSGAPTFYLSDGRNSTWTYSQTISGTTTSGSYDPEGINLLTGAVRTTDSFTLTLTSATNTSARLSGAGHTLNIYFNKQINTLTPNPVALGQQVTVTGGNLSSMTNLGFRDGSKFFSAATSNRTATQLTFTVPLTVVDFMTGLTSNVTPGTYTSTSAPGKTLSVTAALVVVSVSAEEIARLAAVAATAKREIEKRNALAEILSRYKKSESISIETYAQAEIVGVTKENIEAVQAEIIALPVESRSDIKLVLKVARKYEVVGIIASDRVASVYSNSLIEIGLIPEGSKNKAAITAVVKKLPTSERSSYAAIKAVIGIEMAAAQARKDRLATIVARIHSHSNG